MECVTPVANVVLLTTVTELGTGVPLLQVQFCTVTVIVCVLAGQLEPPVLTVYVVVTDGEAVGLEQL